MPPTLHLSATLWSLRQYPTANREWSWQEKFSAIRDAGFDGVLSPPINELTDRGRLTYWAIGSLGPEDDVDTFFRRAADLKAEAVTIQIGDVDTPLESCIELAIRIVQTGADHALPTAIETHRDTFTETPERTWELHDGFLKATGKPLPVCFDHSHFAVVRHIRPPYWPELRGREDILARCRQLHLRPFNGHHCQIPVTDGRGNRTPEYLDWLVYLHELFAFIHHRAEGTVHVVPELGHANPAYGLSCFPDTWDDVRVAAGDLRRAWEAQTGTLQ